jgi:hypothetical protein
MVKCGIPKLYSLIRLFSTVSNGHPRTQLCAAILFTGYGWNKETTMPRRTGRRRAIEETSGVLAGVYRRGVLTKLRAEC